MIGIYDCLGYGPGYDVSLKNEKNIPDRISRCHGIRADELGL